MKNKEQIDEFLGSKEARKLRGLSWLMGFDNNQNRPEEWETSKLKVHVAFLSPGPTRAVSNTYTQLDGLIRSVPEVFVDYSYFPGKDDFDLFIKYKLPFMFGNVSHRSAKEYDLIFMSHSVLVEFINSFHALWNSEIPVYHKERLEADEYPLIIAGGIPIQDHDGMGGNSGIPDLIYSGFGEGGIPEILNELLSRVEKEDLKSKGSKKALIKTFVMSSDNFYFPDGYVMKYDGWEIKSIKPKYDWVPEKVKFHTEREIDGFPGFERKIFTPDGSNATASDMVISAGCAGGMQCNFCEEGTVCGGWREKSIKRLKKSMDETLLNTACNTISFYSFNLSYYGKFIDLIYEAAKRFSKLSLINMRVDMIAEAPEYFDAAYALGIRRASAPIEGFGHRQRNLIMNKNLSRKQIMAAFRTFYSYGIMETKVGMIMTGLETEADLDDAISEFEEILELRKEMGSTAGLRCNVTPLVIYPKTTLRSIPQRTAYNSYKNKKTMQKILEHFRGRIRFKFNGSRSGTFVEQMTLNLGRLGTPIWEQCAKEKYIYYGSPKKEMVATLVKELKWRYDLRPEDFMKGKSKDHIYPTDMIQVKNAEYMKLAEGRIDKKSTPSCTKTPVNKKPKCFECGWCETQEQKDKILKRVIKSVKTTTDIQEAIFRNKSMSAVRVSYNVPDESFAWSKKSFSHLIASKILQNAEWSAGIFHSVSNYSSVFIERDNMRDWVSGHFSFDMRFKIEKLPEITLEANQYLRHIRIVQITEVGKKENISRDCTAVYEIFTQSNQLEVGQAVRDWRGKVRATIKAPVTGYDVKFEEVPLDRSEFSLYLKAYQGGVKLVLVAPAWVNPFSFMQTLLKMGYEKSMSLCKIRMFGLFSKARVGVCRCGAQNRIYLLNNQEAPLCLKCLSKKLLKRE